MIYCREIFFTNVQKIQFHNALCFFFRFGGEQKKNELEKGIWSSRGFLYFSFISRFEFCFLSFIFKIGMGGIILPISFVFFRLFEKISFHFSKRIQFSIFFLKIWLNFLFEIKKNVFCFWMHMILPLMFVFCCLLIRIMNYSLKYNSKLEFQLF